MADLYKLCALFLWSEVFGGKNSHFSSFLRLFDLRPPPITSDHLRQCPNHIRKTSDTSELHPNLIRITSECYVMGRIGELGRKFPTHGRFQSGVSERPRTCPKASDSYLYIRTTSDSDPKVFRICLRISKKKPFVGDRRRESFFRNGP